MDKTRRCWQCNKVAELKGMRYDSTGKDLICESCLAKENRAEVKETATHVVSADDGTVGSTNVHSNYRNVNTSGKKYDDVESKTVSYQCGSCSLGFSVPIGAMVQSCPYCGKGNFRLAIRDSAQKIIEDAQKEKFDD